MRLIKWGFFTLCLLTSFILGFISNNNPSQKKAQNVENKVKTENIRELESQISTINKTITNLKQQTNKSPAEETTKTPKNESAQLTRMDGLEKKPHTRESTLLPSPQNNSIDSKTLNQKTTIQLPQKFDSETVNESWATENKVKLQESFATETALQAKQVKSIECKSSTCRVQIYAENKADLISTAEAINLVIMQKYQNHFIPNVMTTFSATDNTANFYFGDAPSEK